MRTGKSPSIRELPPHRIAQVKIAKVDCDAHRDLCASNNVRGYPTLLLFKDGNREGIKYSGGRDIASFTTFLKEQAPSA